MASRSHTGEHVRNAGASYPQTEPHRGGPVRDIAQLQESDEEMFARLDSGVFRRFAGYLRPYRAKVVMAVIAVFAFTLANLAVPILVKVGVDEAIKTGDKGLVAWIAGGLAITAGVYWVSLYLQQILIQRVAQRILYDIRKDMFRQLQRLSMSFSDRTAIGKLMARMFGDVGALQEMLEASIQVIGDILTLVGIVLVLLVLDWQLAIFTLSVMPLLYLVRHFWRPYARRAFLRIRRNSSIVGSYLDQNVNGIRVIQAMNRQGVNHNVMNGKVGNYFSSTVKGAGLTGVLMPTVDLLTGGALAIVIIVGGNRVLDGTLEVGVMLAFLFYVQRFFEPIRALTMQYSVLQRAVAAGHRIFELLDLPIEVQDRADAKPIGKTDGSVTLDHVTFGYKPGQPVLKDVTFRAEPGETVAIVGPTGSGKTSITNLAHRFYDVWDGRVLLGGTDVRDVTQDSLGGVIGMVLQEPFLFSKSVYENVKYNTASATREDVVQACKTIGAHDFIMKLSDGYDTLLEQRGSNLSIGQRQLLSFARALVADPQILVLDEATANIDSYTEKLIQDALQKLLEDRTALVIAHRLSTIRNSDKIIVLQDGRIVEEGMHEDLIELSGLYAQLWSMNYASFDDLVEKDKEATAATTASS